MDQRPPCMPSFLLCAQLPGCISVCDLMDCSPPGSSVHGIFQARILECTAISDSRGSSWPRDQTCISCVSCSGMWVFMLIHMGSPHAGLPECIFNRQKIPRLLILFGWLQGSMWHYLLFYLICNRVLSIRWFCESAALNMPANLENLAVATGLEKVSFHSNPKRKAMPKNAQSTTLLHSPHTLVK